MLRSMLGRFRLLLWLQGISYLLLLFVAFLSGMQASCLKPSRGLAIYTVFCF